MMTRFAHRAIATALLALIASVSAGAACTATGGLGRFTLGLDPAMTCSDVAAVRRVVAIDLAQVAASGDVIIAAPFLPKEAVRPTAPAQFRFLRAQPIRGLRVTAIAADKREGMEQLVLGWDEPVPFLRAPLERAGWRLTCARLGGVERCEAEREIAAAPGAAPVRVRLQIESLADGPARVSALSRCTIVERAD